MSAATRTATLLPFSPVRATGPTPSSRARRVCGDARTSAAQAPARGALALPAAAPEDAPGGTLRRLAMALGLGAMLLASAGGAGWAFVAAEQATRASLAGYVAAPGGRS